MTPAIPRENEESPRNLLTGKRGPNRDTSKPPAAKRGKKAQGGEADASSEVQVGDSSGATSDETVSSSTTTPATVTSPATVTKPGRKPAPAVGLGTYGRCKDVCVTQDDVDKWNHSLAGEKQVIDALRKKQREHTATKKAITANKHTMDSEADKEPEPASTSSALGHAGSQALLPVEAGDGEEENAGRSVDFAASKGPDAASIPNDSDSDTTPPARDADSEGPFDLADNEGNSESDSDADPEIRNAAQAVVEGDLSVETQEELLARLLRLKADRDAEEKKKLDAARARKRAETRAKNKREREDAAVGRWIALGAFFPYVRL